MNANECLRRVSAGSRISRATIARMGYKSRSELSASMRPERVNARSDRLVRILDAMGYDLVARSRDGRTEYVIDE